MASLRVLLVYSAIVLSVTGCDSYKVFDIIGLCKEEITIGNITPDGRHVASVYQRSCGATTGWATFVNIRPRSTRFRGGGKDVIFGADGLYPIGVYWSDNTHLRVEYIRCPQNKIFKQEKSWKDVAISYVSYPSP